MLQSTNPKSLRGFTLVELLVVITIIGILIALLPGCEKGANRVSLEGAVSVNGKPIEDGAINLVPIIPTAGPSAGAEIVAGRYSITAPKGPVPGKYRVEIVATRKTGKQVPDMMQPGKTVEGIEQYIPEKYNVKSRIEAELREGENKGVAFDLKI
jgi:prepilin-type N-terminal cleavage/methylation domain-containing protein